MVNDGDRNKIGDVSIWRDESKNGVSYLVGIVAKTDGSKLRIVLFDTKKDSGNQKPIQETEDDGDGF